MSIYYFDGTVFGSSDGNSFEMILNSSDSDQDRLRVYQSLIRFRNQVSSMDAAEMFGSFFQNINKAIYSLEAQHLRHVTLEMEFDMKAWMQHELESQTYEVDGHGQYYLSRGHHWMQSCYDAVDQTASMDQGQLLLDVAMVCQSLLQRGADDWVHALRVHWQSFVQEPGYAKVVAWINTLERFVKKTEDFADHVYGKLDKPFKSKWDMSNVSGAYYGATKKASECLVDMIFKDITPFTEQFWVTPEFYINPMERMNNVVLTIKDWMDDLQTCLTQVALRKVYLDTIKWLIYLIVIPLFKKPIHQETDRLLVQFVHTIKDAFLPYTIFPVSINQKTLDMSLQPLLDVAMVLDVDDPFLLPILAECMGKSYPDVHFDFFKHLVQHNPISNAVLEACQAHFAVRVVDPTTKSFFYSYFPAA